MNKCIIFLSSLLSMLGPINCSELVSWSSPASIAGSQNALNAAIARDASGNALVAWQALTGTDNVVRIVYYNASSESWSSVKEIGSAYIKSHIFVSMNSTGQGIIGWIDGNQIVTAVVYTKEDWQSWQPVVVQLSTITDNATEIYMPQNFNSTAYIAWADASGLNFVYYSFATNYWSSPKIIVSGTCNTISCAADDLDTLMLTWIESTGNNNNICATCYKTTQTVDTWVPTVITLSGSNNGLYSHVAVSNQTDQDGTAIFIWQDKYGLQASLYDPNVSWAAWEPSDNKKTITTNVLSSATVAVDTNGNAVFAWQTFLGTCQYIQYSLSQSWSSWAPTEGTTIIEDKTIVNDMALDSSQEALFLLSSLETTRLNSLYVILADSKGYIDVEESISRTCLQASQKMLAFKQNSSSFDIMAVWPSVPSKGILYVTAK